MNPLQNHKRTVIRQSITSTFLNEERTLRFYLPPLYDESKSYPVVYCQDGEEFFNFGRIATQAHQLILENKLEPIIIAAVDVHLNNRTAEYSPDGARFDAYSRFFAEEFLSYVESNFSVHNVASERILAGDSLGGTVSFHLALKYPNIFHKVISLSGAFYTPTTEILKNHHDLSYLDMYMLVGTDETEVKTEQGIIDFLTLNRNMKQQLLDRQAKIHYLERPGKHIWGFWQKHLPDALLYFLQK